MNIIRSEGVKIFKNFKEEEITIKIEGTDKKVSGKTRLKWIKDECNSYFIPKRNVTYERYLFFKRSQESDNNIHAYNTELRRLSKNYEFKELHESLIKYRLIIGMRDEGLRQRLLQEAANHKLTPERVIEFAKTKEICSSQNIEMRENIDYVNNEKYKKPQNDKYERKESYERKKIKCTKCDRIHERKKCKAYGTKCAICKKTGHWAVCCKSKNIEEIRIEDEFQFLGEIKTDMDTNSTWIRNISINNEHKKISVPFKIDTGASVSVMENIPNLPKLMKSNKVFVGPGKTRL